MIANYCVCQTEDVITTLEVDDVDKSNYVTITITTKLPGVLVVTSQGMLNHDGSVLDMICGEILNTHALLCISAAEQLLEQRKINGADNLLQHRSKLIEARKTFHKRAVDTLAATVSN